MKVKLDPGAFMLTKAHDTDAGFDIYSPVDVEVPACGNVVIDTGVHVAIPLGCGGVLMSRSGLNVKHDILSTGLIDYGYTGSIRVKLYNHGYLPYQVKRGDRITQMIITPCFSLELQQVDELNGSERGSDGFGSSGR